MFNSLKVAAPLVEAPAVMNEALADAFIDALPDVPAHMALVADHRQTQTELNALISAIETHGLSKSLVAFAGHDGTLFAVAPSIPALEAFTTDLSEEDTAKIVAELKAIDLTAPLRFDADADEDNEGAVEAASVRQILMTFIVPFYAAITLVKGLRHWNTTADDKEGRLAKVLPFKTLMGYLHGASDVARIYKELAGLELPKTEEECKHFAERVHAAVKPLEFIGLHVEDGHITVRPFPKAVKNNIETLGYHEGSLAEIGEVAEKLKNDRFDVSSDDFEEMHKRWMALPKEERKIAGQAYDLAFDVAETALHRLGKVLKLVKSNVGMLKKFYKA